MQVSLTFWGNRQHRGVVGAKFASCRDFADFAERPARSYEGWMRLDCARAGFSSLAECEHTLRHWYEFEDVDYP